MNYLCAVDTCFADKPGGMARVAWDAAVAMRDRGYNVTIFCTQMGSVDTPPREQCDGMRIVRYQRPSLPRWHPGRARRAIWAAGQAARAELFDQTWDVVHMHSPFTGLGVMRTFGGGPRYVYTMHSPVVLEQRINWARQGLPGRLKLLLGLRQLRRIEAELLRRSAAVQALSQYTKQQVGRFHGLADRVTVIPHWRRPDLHRQHDKEEARRRLGWPQKEHVLFTVRRHGPRYGLDVAIRAVAPLAAAKRCTFYVAGDGPLRPSLEDLAGTLGAGEGIRFPGRITDQQLALSYEAADLFLLPTTALECFGLITLEAFAFGCPVLSTDVCALPETIAPIMPEFIVPAADVEALRRKVEEFLERKLVPPSQQRLMAYLDDRYDESVVLPRLVALLEGRGK